MAGLSLLLRRRGVLDGWLMLRVVERKKIEGVVVTYARAHWL
jgi:hypothetical protein